MSDIVPFGKHKGKPVEALLDDRPYLDWLLSQPWFKEKFGNVYNIVINAGQEPVETPEHNAMQIRFLKLDFRLKLAQALKPVQALIPPEKLPTNPVFEKDGIDVQFWTRGRYYSDSDLCCVEIKPTVGDDYPSVFRQIQRYKEIPEWPNDRSSSTKRYANALFVLLIRSYTGIGATKEQFIQFFQSQGVRVVFESDVDAVILPSEGDVAQ